MSNRRNNVNLLNPQFLGMEMDDLDMGDFDLHELQHVLQEANNYDEGMGEFDDGEEYELVEAGDGDEGSEDPDSFYHSNMDDNHQLDPSSSSSSWQHNNNNQPRSSNSHHRQSHLPHNNNNNGLSTSNTTEFEFFDNLLTMSSSPSEVERRMEEYWSRQSSSSPIMGKDETHVNFSDLDQEVPDWRSH